MAEWAQNNTWNLHRFLTNSEHLTQLRVSIISYNSSNVQHRIVWSRARGGGEDLDDKPVTRI